MQKLSRRWAPSARFFVLLRETKRYADGEDDGEVPNSYGCFGATLTSLIVVADFRRMVQIGFTLGIGDIENNRNVVSY